MQDARGARSAVSAQSGACLSNRTTVGSAGPARSVSKIFTSHVLCE